MGVFARVQFGDYEADLGSGELRRNGLKVKLGDQSFQVLALLLEHPSEVVTRAELRQKLWTEDTFVDFEAGLNSAIKRLRDALRDSADEPRFIETLPRRGYRFIAPVATCEPAVPPRVESLAVLPLENLTGDPAQDYFVDGMTDALITRLAQIGALRVISRTSAMQYKGAHAPLPDIARKLRVDAVVEGTVTRSGDRVRVTAQLIDARTDRHLWAEEYERDVRDILTLQSEVARAIAGQIQVALTPQEEARLAGSRRVDPEAYENYLKGRFHWNKRTEEGLRASVGYFDRAIERDPSYARAYAGLADTYFMLGVWGFAPSKEAYPKAKAAARQALEIDESLGEAHASLGVLKAAHERDWVGSERHFRRAIELNPNYAPAHQWYGGFYFNSLRRPAEARARFQRALELDPLSLIIHATFGWTLYHARQYEDAIREHRQALELDPNSAPARLLLGRTYEQTGGYEAAKAEFEQAIALSQGRPLYEAQLGHLYAVTRKRAEALKIAASLRSRSRVELVPSYLLAELYAGLDDRDAALEWLEKAYLEGDSWMVWLTVEPRLDGLRGDPRFQDLLRRMNFPQITAQAHQ